MLNIHVGNLVIPRNWPDTHISLDEDPTPGVDLIGKLIPWKPGTGPGIIVGMVPVKGSFNSQWVKVFSPTASGWCFSNELVVIE